MTKKIQPINSAARDGSLVYVVQGGTIAKAVWTGTMWAYECAPNVQLDFEPTGWVRCPQNFLGE
jgi:hypothetical protein